MRYSKKRRWKNKVWIFTAILLGIIFLLYIYMILFVNPIIFKTSEAKILELTSKAVGSAVWDVVNDNLTIYDDLIHITKNNDGDIVMISTNSMEINRLTRNFTRAAQNNLDLIGQTGIDIPLGTFTGIPFLNGVGPAISIKLLPIGSISAHFVSEFVSAGVNQTNHRIYVFVTSSVHMILPTASTVFSGQTQILIADAIIIGKVPSVYLGGTSLGEMLNLVP